MSKIALVMLTVIGLGWQEGQAATIVTLDFADLSQSGTSIALVDSPYTAQGIGVYDSSLQFLMWQTEGENYFGATALIPGFFDSVTTLSRTDSGVFDLLSIDLAKLALGLTDPQTLLLTGILPDLSTVTQTCVISATASFTTCSLGPQFVGLSSVGWSNEALFQYTNITISADFAVPEPSTFVMTASVLALLILVLFLKRRDSRTSSV